MTAKLVVWDEDRPRALARRREALAQCGIEGPKSNIAFLERLGRHPVVVEASIDTGYLDRHLEDFIGAGGDAGPIAAAATAVVGELKLLVPLEGLVDQIGRASCRERVCQYV